MIPNRFLHFFTTLLLVIMFVFFGCERNNNLLDPASHPTDPEVFLDDFSSGLNYAAFGGSKVDAFDVDMTVTYKGTKSMRIAVPNAGDPEGAYAGGAYFTDIGRDLSGYDALTFWAKASKGATLDLVGIGNDLTGTSRFIATRSGLLLNTNWKKYYIPIPDPAKLTAERGLFFYSEGPENNFGYTIWFDEVQFEKLGTLAHPRPAILEEQNQTFSAEPGDRLPIGGTFVIYNMPNGIDERTEAAPGYFTFISSDSSVATVDEDGVVTVIDSGSATITAKLGSVDATGSLTVNVGGVQPGPSNPAPTPTVPASNVISLFSNAYTDVTVDTWSAVWDNADVTDVQISGDDVKLYTNLVFAGIEFLSQEVDATSMTHFHMDIWTPDPTAAPAVFKIKLVNDVFGSISEHELEFTASSNPPLVTGNWISFDIPFSDFVNLAGRDKLGQLIISGDPNTVYVDNIYFYSSGGGATEPSTPAPTPTFPAGDVISVFSDVYTDIAGTNLNPDWGQATVVTEEYIQGDTTLLYTGLNYQGIELGSNQNLSAAGMVYLHLDFWTANSTDLGVFLISPGPVETEVLLVPPGTTANWVSVDIPLTDFAPVDLTDIIQFKFEGNGNIYLDNLFFHK